MNFYNSNNSQVLQFYFFGEYIRNIFTREVVCPFKKLFCTNVNYKFPLILQPDTLSGKFDVFDRRQYSGADISLICKLLAACKIDLFLLTFE